MTRYNILIDGKVAYKELTQDEYFSTMEDLAQEFYDTGVPHPKSILTEFIEEWQR